MGPLDSNQEFDPTLGAPLQQELVRCSVGKSPSGFRKIRSEMMPADLIKMIGYDPRTIQAAGRRGQQEPHNVSEDLLELVRDVQRSIDGAKIQEMVGYLHHAMSTGDYGDWAELEIVTAAKPDMAKYEQTHSVFFPASAEYFITDGQHRFCSLMDFVRQDPEYAPKFTQAVAISVLPEDRLGKWAGQSSHDKNYLRSQVKMTKALAVDSRDLHNVLAKELHDHRVVKAGGGVNEQKDSLAAKASEFATHAVLYRFARAFCEGRRGLDKAPIKNPHLTSEMYDMWKTRINQYVDELHRALPNWTADPEVRKDYLFRASAALQALGVIGNDLAKVKDANSRRNMVVQLSEAQRDWRRSNITVWGDVIGTVVTDEETAKQSVTPKSSRQAIDGTIRFLREHTVLAEFLARMQEEMNKQAQEPMMKALFSDDSNDSNEEE
jgi:hypothetical protein